MLIHRKVRPLLYHLEEIVIANRRKFSRCQSFMLYQILLDFMRYWRELQSTHFHRLSFTEQDELYFFFTEKLLHVFDDHLDLYWLIADIDGQPLYEDSREPDLFWCKKLEKPEFSLKRFELIY